MANKRKQARVAIRQLGAIYKDGILLGECTILDVSSSGARVLLEHDMDAPTKFTIYMARRGSVQRHCQTVWQAEKEVGVRFLEG
jgi:hypothetical protein